MKIRQNGRLCLLLFLLCALGCKKNLFEKRETPQFDAIVSNENFFANYDYKDNEINLLIANIKSSENRHHFLDEIIKKHGTPSWSNVFYSLSENNIEASEASIKASSVKGSGNGTKALTKKTGVFFVPLVNNFSKEVTAYVYAEKQSDSEFIYKVYNKKELLTTTFLDQKKKEDIKLHLAMFAYFDRKVFKKKSVSYSGTQEYKFKNVIVQPLKKKVAQSAIQNKPNSLASPCEKVIAIFEIFDDGSWVYTVEIRSTCTTLPEVTVTGYINTGGGGGGGGYPTFGLGSAGYIGGGFGMPTGGYSNGGQVTSGTTPTGWSENSWNIYWSSLVEGRPTIYQGAVANILANIPLTENETYWVQDNGMQALKFSEYLEEAEYNAESIWSIQTMIGLFEAGYDTYQSDAIFNTVLAAKLPTSISFPNDVVTQYISLFYYQMKVLFPNDYWWKNMARALEEWGHFVLDVGGLLPVVGEIFDIVNAGWYTLQGKYVLAGMSLTQAVPFAGIIPATAKIASFAGVPFMVKVGNKWKYLRSSYRMRKELGLVKGDGLIAHHILPLGEDGHNLIQAAANGGFDLNKAVNGIALDAAFHKGSHPAYSAKIRGKMDAIMSAYNNSITPQQASSELQSLITTIRNAIANQPNTKINDLIF